MLIMINKTQRFVTAPASRLLGGGAVTHPTPPNPRRRGAAWLGLHTPVHWREGAKGLGGGGCALHVALRAGRVRAQVVQAQALAAAVRGTCARPRPRARPAAHAGLLRVQGIARGQGLGLVQPTVLVQGAVRVRGSVLVQGPVRVQCTRLARSRGDRRHPCEVLEGAGLLPPVRSAPPTLFGQAERGGARLRAAPPPSPSCRHGALI